MTGLGQMAAFFSKRSICRLSLVTTITLLVGAASVSAAQGACHRTVSVGTPLQRQVAAIRKLELKYGCENRLGGLFSLCRDLANRRARIQRHPSWGKHVVVRSGSCKQTLRKTPAARPPAALGFALDDALYCVRLSDGYFFPAPRSQFMTRAEIPAASEQCRFICNDPAMALYVRRLGSESVDMRALHGRSRYGDLSTAFKYRDDPAFARCDHSRYHRRVVALRAQLATVSALGDMVVPRPTFRPELEASIAPLEGASQPNVSFEQTSSIRPNRVIELSATAGVTSQSELPRKK
jgi:hypothetical protein